MMRVLHLAPRLSSRGGADWHLLGVVEALGQRRVEQALCYGFDDGSASAPCPGSRMPGLEARDAQPVALDAPAPPSRCHVVHMHSVVNPTVLEWGCGRPTVLTVQDHRFFCPGRGKWRASGEVCREPMSRERCAHCFDDAGYFEEIYALTRRRLAAARALAAVTVLSEYMRRELVAVGLDPDRVHVIPPFVHGLDPGAAADGPGCALFAGRLVEAKGVRDAVAAWQRSGVSLPLLVAGTGSQRAALERALPPGVELLGWVPHAQLSSLYARARVLIFPPRWQEPFGIAGLEALSCGVPVAAWQSGGVVEWHPDSGLPQWGDVDGLAAAVRSSVGRVAGRPRGFERAALTSRLEQVYRSIAR